MGGRYGSGSPQGHIEIATNHAAVYSRRRTVEHDRATAARTDCTNITATRRHRFVVAREPAKFAGRRTCR